MLSVLTVGSLPNAELLSHISSFGATATTVTPSLGVAPTTLSWSVASAAGGGNTLATQLAALLPGMSQQQVNTDRVTIGTGLPTIPKKLLDRMHRWEYIDLADLLPQTSAHDAATPEVDPHRFVLFLGCEFIKLNPKSIRWSPLPSG